MAVLLNWNAVNGGAVLGGGPGGQRRGAGGIGDLHTTYKVLKRGLRN